MDVNFLEKMEIPIGALVKIELRGKDVMPKSKVKGMVGIVTACNKRHFTVRCKTWYGGPGYSQSYLKADLVLGLVVLTDLKGKNREEKGDTMMGLRHQFDEGEDQSLGNNNLELALGATK